MGISRMLTYLRDRNIINKREFLHEVRPEAVKSDDCCSGPGFVFDNRTLVEHLLMEWEKLPDSHYLRFDPTKGGHITQFRVFSRYYLKHLVEVYQCTIVWVRDAGVNDKPTVIPDRVYYFVKTACEETDRAIKSPDRRNAVDIVSRKYWPEENYEEFLVETIAGAGLESSVVIVDAPANGADAEVWRQARRMSTARRTFIFSADTDMFFFASTTRNVGIVLFVQPHPSHYWYGTQDGGLQWSCDLRGDPSATRRLSLKFCCVEDVATVFDIEPQCLPVLGACLGSNLSVFDISVRKFTVRLQSALLRKHFGTSAVAQAIRRPAEDLRKDVQAVSKARMQGLLGNSKCDDGEFCSRPFCQRIHPPGGNLRCKKEMLPPGRCTNPTCRFRHTRPISFRIAPKFVDKYDGHEALKSTVYDTWEQAVAAVDGIADEWKKRSHGVSLATIPPGFGLSFYDENRRTIFRKSSELVRTLGRGADSEIDIDACVRGLCGWLDNSSSDGVDHPMAQAIVKALECYQPLPVDQHPPPVELQAPHRTLETWRLRRFYWATPYPLPSDTANLNHITEHLRAAIAQKLGIAQFVEGVQIGSRYIVTKITSGGGFEEQHGEESSSPVGGRNGSPTESLAEALGFKSGTDEQWLQDLDTILQTLPELLVPDIAMGCDQDRNTRVTVSYVGTDNVGVMKTVLLSITLWQRTLSSSRVREPNIAEKYAYENVETLKRWEVRAFIGSAILGWIQLQLEACPFNLLTAIEETGKENGDGFLFLSLPANLRRRAFLLAAQFFELTNDVKHLTSMLCHEQDDMVHGMREICLNPEMIFSVYTAVGRAKPENERDQRVRSKLIAIASSGKVINSALFTNICDRLVDHVMGTRSTIFDYLEVDDWEDLSGLSL